MKSDIERLYLIDRYLKGELTGPALDEFKTRMRIDPEFAGEIESQRAIIEGIKLARRQHLISILNGEKVPAVITTNEKTSDTEPEQKVSDTIFKEEQPEKQYRLEPNYNKWYFAAVAVLFTALGLLFLFGYYLPRQNREYADSDTTKTKVAEKEVIETPAKDEKEDLPELAQNPFTKDSADDKKEELVKKEDILPTPPTSDTLKIEKDKKIAENIFSVPAYESNDQNASKKDNNVSSGDQNNLKKFNVKKVRGATIKVEYWQSVVNFKGYKLSGSNLQIFDVKPEDKVGLKYLDKQLYLKKGGNYYKLVSSGNFEQYQKESNTEIIKLLETN